MEQLSQVDCCEYCNEHSLRYDYVDQRKKF